MFLRKEGDVFVVQLKDVDNGQTAVEKLIEARMCSRKISNGHHAMAPLSASASSKAPPTLGIASRSPPTLGNASPVDQPPVLTEVSNIRRGLPDKRYSVFTLEVLSS